MFAEKNLDSLERETLITTSIISNSLLLKDLGFQKGKRKGNEKETLSQKIKNHYGIDYENDNLMLELKMLNKFKNEIKAMDEIKAFTKSSLTFLVDKHENDKNIKKLIDLLVSNDILDLLVFIGKARRTYETSVYYTEDCTDERMLQVLKIFIAKDEGRWQKQLQRDAKKKKLTVVEQVDRNVEVQQETIKRKKEQPLTRQDKAKAILASDTINVHRDEFERENKELEQHKGTCQNCRESRLWETENTCNEFIRLYQRAKRHSKEMIKEIAKNPDHINEVLSNDINILDEVKKLE